MSMRLDGAASAGRSGGADWTAPAHDGRFAGHALEFPVWLGGNARVEVGLVPEIHSAGAEQ
jgi:hypothetical protein